MQFFSGEVFVCWYKPPFCITCAGKEKKAGRRSQCSRCPLSEWTPWRGDKPGLLSLNLAFWFPIGLLNLHPTGLAHFLSLAFRVSGLRSLFPPFVFPVKQWFLLLPLMNLLDHSGMSELLYPYWRIRLSTRQLLNLSQLNQQPLVQ